MQIVLINGWYYIRKRHWFSWKYYDESYESGFWWWPDYREIFATKFRSLDEAKVVYDRLNKPHIEIMWPPSANF